MFHSVLTLFFVVVLSSCAGKTLSNTNDGAGKTATATSTPPPAVEATKADSTKPAQNWPKVDAYDCKANNDVRNIHIELTTPAGCKLWYSNYSKSEPIAWSKNGLTHCEKVNQNIRHNLENAGYACTPKEANKPTK